MQSAVTGLTAGDTGVFDRYESEVRTYCRDFPVVFQRARGSEMFDERGHRWIDFFCGAGALNYGHNPEFVKERLLEYIAGDGITHGLDLHTVAKRDFIEAFVEVVLRPRGLDYRFQFCGPTGANAVEAGLKLSRKVTGRTQVVAFSGGWHGMTAGCLAVTSRKDHRRTAGIPLANVSIFPFPEGPTPFPESLALLERMLTDSHSGLDHPAAFILEAVQAEGGVYVAPDEFLQKLRGLCDRHGILLIVDDIQAGCGRTGNFFSFESAGIVPDIVCLSKSISGYGMPMSLVLIRPEIDMWSPGEHTGTYRGNQLAFLAATAVLDLWRDRGLERDVARKHRIAMDFLAAGFRAMRCPPQIRGRGLLLGVELDGLGGRAAAAAVVQLCFERGLIVESCGRDGSVIKLLPALTIPDEQLREGLEILVTAIVEVEKGKR